MSASEKTLPSLDFCLKGFALGDIDELLGLLTCTGSGAGLLDKVFAGADAGLGVGCEVDCLGALIGMWRLGPGSSSSTLSSLSSSLSSPPGSSAGLGLDETCLIQRSLHD